MLPLHLGDDAIDDTGSKLRHILQGGSDLVNEGLLPIAREGLRGSCSSVRLGM